MKRILFLTTMVVALLFGGCAQEFDDSEIWDKLDNHESRITALEELCRQMNTNISSLQTIVSALQNNDYVTGVAPITKNGETIGYAITFTKSQPITIYHGENGKDGQNGTNGVDGKDGSTPVIGVKMDDDGIYYWTLNGEWLTDENGNKIKAVGTDGKDGANGTDGEDGKDGQNGTNGTDGKDGQNGTNGADGKDGITPQLKIEEGYWFISYDNGATWTQLGKATGEDGKDGANGQDGTNGTNGTNGVDGDSFFQSVDTSNQEYVVFTLADGTEIQLPTWYAFEQLRTLCNQMNSNISALQSIVEALQNNDYVTSVSPITENGTTIGYTIYFSKSNPVTIYHGKDGKDGQNGTNGVDGKDGSTPVIGVKMDDDGVYYWTLNGEWLTDENGNKIKAVGTDGKDGADGKDGQDGADGKDGENGADGKDGQNGTDGADGKDGITPQLKIEEGYWFISYDNGATWTQLGKATGEDGKDGANGLDGTNGTNGTNGVDGDSFFQSVTQDENNVYIVLADGTEITIPKKINLDDVKLTYIPRYDDGKATVIYSYKSDSYVELDFEVSPASKAADWSDITTVKAVYTESRAGVEFVDMDIMSWSTDATNGTISVKASGRNLSDDFFDGNQSASVRITMENDDVNIISEYIPMVVERLPVPESNEIWYTATEKVTPNASDVFGANIVSNVWDESTGKGIISFDGDVTSIGEEAFYRCSSLTSITIPEGVTSIGNSALSSCSSLTSIIIPESVTSIGNDAFSGFFGCSSLTSITIPESVNSIGNSAFFGCSSLTSITIPESVTSIGVNPFRGCDNLKEFSGKYASNNGRCLIVDGVLNSFAPAGLTEYIIPEGVTSIGDWAFYDCSSLTSITIPEGVTSIGEHAFSQCLSLTSITIPESVTSIGNSAFDYCSSLTSISIPEGVTSIEWGAFHYCSSLTSISIPEGVTSIESYAFLGCSSLTSITIPEGVTSIGYGAFEGCSSLTSITIPEGVTSIGFNPFAKCINLKEFNGKFASTDGRCLIVDGVLNSFAPAGLTEYTIPEGVTSIGVSAFYNCSSLTSIIIPESVTSIGGSAFSDCSSLTTIIIPEGVTSIGNNAFGGCSSLMSIIIPEGVTSIGSYAFAVCSSLKEVYCKPTTPPNGKSGMFNSNAPGRKIYVPASDDDSIINAYKTADGWKQYADAIEEYEFD